MKTVEERFWSKVDRSGECWLWTAAVDSCGYGRFMLEGKARKAHRVALALTSAPPPDDMEVLHSCDTPPCVNPAHLSVGTHRENMRQMVERDRRSSHKVTEAQRQEIRRRFVREYARRSRGGGWRNNTYELAAEFGLTHEYIRGLCVGKNR